ncbi:MAG: cellulase [Deltaproteobacteria bacterium]|nr:cellulase [Deltaproteobacteria bacterium]MBW1952736.1 cellulase [Deltaproteobacteria bacterium]MBW1986369.1 cellulase [Deltaproteobacteria bacterium]MBW2133762.1 cellulase [Deltaproteobacteria bacterium]
MVKLKYFKWLIMAVASWALVACSAPPTDSGWEERLDHILRQTWEGYRVNFISPGGRVIRPENQQDSISEGQAYAMLRAVWSQDQATFDRCYAWTEAHLSRLRAKGDHLLAWRWGQTSNGQWQVLDWNSASDADLDYALALILAHRQWGRPSPPLPGYLAQARLILDDILAQETATDASSRRWLTPGCWIAPKLPLLLNPSYFSPAAYRLFYGVSQDRRWLELIDSTYYALGKISRQLGSMRGAGLFPDWCVLATPDRFDPSAAHSSNFGWEAVRIPWRLALDQLWFQEPRALKCLQESLLPFFSRQWRERQKLAAVYTYPGQPAVDYESPVIYAGLAAAALAGKEPALARQWTEKIVATYQEGSQGGYFNRPDDYYGNNWAWLGLATYRGWVKPFNTWRSSNRASSPSAGTNPKTACQTDGLSMHK